MKIKLLSALLIAMISLTGHSQDFPFSATPLSATDSIFLTNLPQIKLPAAYKSKELPDYHNNSELPWFRPIFNQYGWSCGQASTIGYTFTYELNRLRNLSADSDTSQYHPAFTYNYFTGGESGVGVCYYYSYDAIKHAGNPTIHDFGDIDNGLTVWMDSYDKYYNAMHNRIEGVYSIYVGDEDGLLTLKHWLMDHLDGSETGGLANFYTDLLGYTSLPPESPEVGKHVITQFGEYTGHSMTFLGWNDSIRYDYNVDGQFTNNIDINGDGIVNMKDWEIGGVILANSWGDGWADGGFCYVMYKVLAEEKADGGIWNKSVNVIKAKEEYEPMLTFKVTLKHDSRNKIKVIAGISTDTTALLPEKTMDFPIFNFQGGSYYMQGDYSGEEFKTLEFGLDVTPLLSYIENGEPARFFFQVLENDPNNEGTGDLLTFSLLDYTNGKNEIICQQTPVDLVENGLTNVSVVHTIAIDKVNIDTEEIPPFTSGEPYSAQLSATGGQEPYKWEIARDYFENQEEESYPNIEAEQLTPTNNNHGYAKKGMGFSFPYYGKTYDTVMVHTDGFIMFRETNLPLPYQVDDMVLFKYETMIAPFLNKELLIASPADKILYEGNEEYASFRWKENIVTDEGMVPVDFTCTLFPDGRIEYNYTNLLFNGNVNWITGLSKGDGNNYQVSAFSNMTPIENDQKITFIPDNTLSQIDIDSNGQITAFPDDETKIYNVGIRVTDNNEIANTRTYQLSSKLLFEYSILSGGDDHVNYGDTARISFIITNTSSETINNLTLDASLSDSFFNLFDDSEVIGDLEAGQSIIVQNALAFKVSEFVPDEHAVNIDLTFNSMEQYWAANINVMAYSPKLTIGDLIINDGNNNKLDPGDTANLIFRIENKGHAAIGPVTGILETTDPYITFLSSGNLDFGTLLYGSSMNDTVKVSIDENTPPEHLAVLDLTINAIPLPQTEESFELLIGRHAILLIDLDPVSLSAPAIQSALEELDLSYIYSNQFPGNPNDYQNILITLGRYNNEHILSAYEGHILAEFLNGGGNLYMEGGRTWVDDIQTEVHPMFNTTIETASWYEVDSAFGVPFTFTNGMEFNYSGEIVYYDFNFIPESPAYAVLHGQIPNQISMVAYDEGNYKTIASMLDFGGFDDGEYPSSKKKLLANILDFFGMEGLLTAENETSSIGNNPGFSCFPNPAPGKTNFVFALDEPGNVDLDIISINGKEKIRVVSNQSFPKGQNQITWNGTEHNLLPGVYVCRLRTSKESRMIKLLVF